jgi:hypothetical protein
MESMIVPVGAGFALALANPFVKTTPLPAVTVNFTGAVEWSVMEAGASMLVVVGIFSCSVALRTSEVRWPPFKTPAGEETGPAVRRGMAILGAGSEGVDPAGRCSAPTTARRPKSATGIIATASRKRIIFHLNEVAHLNT